MHKTSLNKTVHAFGKNAYKNALMGVKAFVNRRRGLKDFHTFGLHDDTRSMISLVRHAIPYHKNESETERFSETLSKLTETHHAAHTTYVWPKHI